MRINNLLISNYCVYLYLNCYKMFVSRKLFYFTALFFIIRLNAFSSDIRNFNPDSIPENTYSLSVKYVDMISTHKNRFRGANIMLSEKISNNLKCGVGIEYSYGSYYSDVYFNLHNLSYIPIFFDLTYKIKTTNNLKPFLSIDPGLTFANYNLEIKNELNKKILVRELGFYLYTGIGLKYQIDDHLSAILDFGFKGYKMSFNNLDMNPHGLVIRTGLVFQ